MPNVPMVWLIRTQSTRMMRVECFRMSIQGSLSYLWASIEGSFVNSLQKIHRDGTKCIGALLIIIPVLESDCNRTVRYKTVRFCTRRFKMTDAPHGSHLVLSAAGEPQRLTNKLRPVVVAPGTRHPSLGTLPLTGRALFGRLRY